MMNEFQIDGVCLHAGATVHTDMQPLWNDCEIVTLLCKFSCLHIKTLSLDVGDSSLENVNNLEH